MTTRVATDSAHASTNHRASGSSRLADSGGLTRLALRANHALASSWVPPARLAGTSSNSVSTVHHFYDKLLLLKDLMNTLTGRKLAEERHNYMVRYLDQFFREWNAETDR